ncbi:hypothetical protein CD201_08215 [Hafnia alvei]|nr:hypothetical protein CD201_08215 [Hafnia alvei]
MKLKSSSVNKLKRKQPIVMSLIRKHFKTSAGALISTLFILILYVSIFFDIQIFPYLSTISSIASTVATIVICLFTVKSVLEVIKSNEENTQNNRARDKKESFEKKFALLLQEHNNYLGKLVSSNNLLYRLDYILIRTGYESRSIIRGDAKFVTIDGDDFYYSNEKLFVKLASIKRKDRKSLYLNPSDDVLSKYDLYASGERFYLYSEQLDKMIEMTYTPSILDANEIKEIVKNKIGKGIKHAPHLINNSNNISKNILSPYMRIIYHLLKASKENAATKQDMKKYTNIVRSIIPYDILMLIAINAMYFYKSPNESNYGVKRWSDLFNTSDDSFFNDYYKYYQLLVECDFFEHLVMNFSNVMTKLENVRFDFDLSEINYMTCKTDKLIRKTLEERRYLLLFGDTYYNLSVLYEKFNEATMKLDTDILVLFFFNEDRRIEITKEEIMDNLIFKNRNIKNEGRLKDQFYNNTYYSRTSCVYKNESVMSLSRDFYCLYTRGGLPEIYDNGFAGGKFK